MQVFIRIYFTLGLLFGGVCTASRPASAATVDNPLGDGNGSLKGAYEPLGGDCRDKFVGPLLPGREELKDLYDVLRYVKTHFGAAPSKSYQDYIWRASHAFTLPPSILTCLYVRESGPRLDQLAESDKGATGISQLMPTPKTEIIDILRGVRRNAYSRELRAMWNQFWAGGRRAKGDPKQITAESFADPEVSIVGGTFWLRYYYMRLFPGKERTGRALLESLLQASAAYNLGINTYRRACEGKTYEACEGALKEVSGETYTHMVTIRHCLERNNWKSMDRDEARH